MRKIISIFFVYMIFCFLIPSVFIQNKEVKNKFVIDKIKLLITETGEIVELDLNDYLKGVLVGEVPATYDIEALKAQAVVARTYTLYKLKSNPNIHENADICDDPNHCQAYKSKEYAFGVWKDDEKEKYWKKIENAVNSTNEEVITYNGEIINAFFHAHSGGKTEDASYIWGQKNIPYLKSVEGNESYLFEDKKVFAKNDFKEIIKEKYADYDENVGNISIIDYTMGDRVYHAKVGNIVLLGTELRKLLRASFKQF